MYRYYISVIPCTTIEKISILSSSECQSVSRFVQASAAAQICFVMLTWTVGKAAVFEIYSVNYYFCKADLHVN